MADDILEVDPIPTPDQRGESGGGSHVQSWDACGYTKLNLWTLGREECGAYDAVVYIDADCVVTESIGDIFKRLGPEGEGTVELVAAPDIFPPDKFNAGVLGLVPSDEVFDRMLAQVSILPSHDGGDTGFLNAFFPDWWRSPPAARLPFRYNAQRTLHWFTHEKQPGYWNAVQPVKVIHFSSSPKPWECPDKKGELELIWWQNFMAAQMQMAMPSF
eukprot:CAMPEP_0185749290 /NCGR_PEP_ID=MMETSP1174-20130828/8023_1 /TAXON_ID=35687 /ORGANISM="Dictyocha speculum, Strain CCMP1381" /LENGTH=215 /DNA_ID=CAMNT_0028425345 /DNA_START=8 /DNA_END=655 /DNA_ORIENTATION=+